MIAIDREKFEYKAGQYHVHLVENEKSNSYRILIWGNGRCGRQKEWYSIAAFRFKPGNERAREKAFDKACKKAKEKEEKWKKLFERQ